MQNKYLSRLVLIVSLIFVSTANAQVGINTSTPNGALEINSTTQGVIFPTVTLVDVNTPTVINPKGDPLVAGTTVYNMSTVNNGEYSLDPGFYFWSGTQWIPQGDKKDNKLFLQSTSRRTGSSDIINPVLGNQVITFNANTFTPKFNGKYKLTLTTHFGAGRTNATSSPQFVNFAKQGGEFNFTFNSVTHTYRLNSFAGSNNDKLFKGGTLRRYENNVNQNSIEIEEVLTAGTNYTFVLTFNQDDADGFEGNGDISIVPAGDGRGYITINGNMKCSLEFNYLGQQ
ncbi:hypothetical protein [Ulvibacter antarcticus]|uniref:Uncharacterized protein n=1 Tax=Ulvibacter antarcticus TaxID=442714 RepID=A0A3L9YE03_9FLAO|nr:hypothetical protein [Ulvibacter antarcticus]RMA57667.1 hypothetical protein BXY75_2471 [Ulvibacter antarcticus]